MKYIYWAIFQIRLELNCRADSKNTHLLVYLYNFAFLVFSKIKQVQPQDKQPNFEMIRIIYEMELKCSTTLRCTVTRDG